MQRLFVYSTLTNSHAYTNWTRPSDPLKRPEIVVQDNGFKEQVLIEGGANLANSNVITPLGMRTEIDERQYEVLKRNTMFQRHLEQGFLVVKTEVDDPELIAKKYMAARDASAPLTPNSDIFQGDAPEVVKPKEDIGNKIVSAVRGVFS